MKYLWFMSATFSNVITLCHALDPSWMILWMWTRPFPLRPCSWFIHSIIFWSHVPGIHPCCAILATPYLGPTLHAWTTLWLPVGGAIHYCPRSTVKLGLIDKHSNNWADTVDTWKYLEAQCHVWAVGINIWWVNYLVASCRGGHLYIIAPPTPSSQVWWRNPPTIEHMDAFRTTFAGSVPRISSWHQHLMGELPCGWL